MSFICQKNALVPFLIALSNKEVVCLRNCITGNCWIGKNNDQRGTHYPAEADVGQTRQGHAHAKTDDPVFKHFGEIYFSVINLGFVKAWRLHEKMTCNLAVISGTVTLVLYDSRSDSPTYRDI